MEIEDFDEDDSFPPPAPQRPLMSTPPAPRRGGFGLASEAKAEADVGLAAELQQRLEIQPPLVGGQPQPVGSYGLDAEAGASRPPPPPARAFSGGPPPPALRGRGGLQPLGGAAGAPRPGPSPLAPLRPPSSSATGAPRPQDGAAAAFGLAAETEEPADPLPGPGFSEPRAAPAPAPPASQPRPAAAFGLASEAELRAGLPPPRQRSALPPSPLRPQRPLPAAPAPEAEYGLDQDVQEAAAVGGLPPPPSPPLQMRQQQQPGGYGLAGDIAEADLDDAAAVAAAAAAAGAVPPPDGYGLEQEVYATGPPPPPVGQPPLGYSGLPAPQGQDMYGGYGYGLENDIMQEQQQLQMWSRPLEGTVGLEQLLADLPEGQRWLHVEARQAERFMVDLARQGVTPKIVDLKAVREQLIESSNPPRLAYLATLEQSAPDRRLPPNCRPSLLQAKLKSGQNKLRKVLDPVLDPGGQGFVDLSYSPDGALLPETSRVWQFGLALVQADGVGKTGLQRARPPCLFIARLALFDRRANRFLGNVLGLRPEAVSHADKRWEFDPRERVIVRCGCVQSDPQAGTRLVTDDALSIFVEFNISYRLAVQDTANMPQSETKCARLLDEINTCWAMISFKKCTTLTREVEINVPLYYGSIYDPKPMTAFYAEKRSKAPFWSAFKAKESPVMQFRVGPLNVGKPPLVPYAYMPATVLATHDLGTALAAYRMSLALCLARQAGPFAAASDPVLTGFPPLLGDHHLLAEFLTRWKDLTRKMTAVVDADRGCCSPEVLPPLSAMVEAFRRCVVELAPLAHCPTIPPRHINNFVEYQGHRLRLVQHYCHVLDPKSHAILGARHPVEPLSHCGFEFLHAPFDVSEIRLCMADRLERPEPFFRH